MKRNSNRVETSSFADGERQVAEGRELLTEERAQTLFTTEAFIFKAWFPSITPSLTVLHVEHMRGRHAERDVADATPATGEIRVVERLLRMGRDNFLGVIRHELGHLCDEQIEEPEAEMRADLIALFVTLKPIRYDRIELQTVGDGEWPRPRDLHR